MCRSLRATATGPRPKRPSPGGGAGKRPHHSEKWQDPSACPDGTFRVKPRETRSSRVHLASAGSLTPPALAAVPLYRPSEAEAVPLSASTRWNRAQVGGSTSRSKLIFTMSANSLPNLGNQLAADDSDDSD